MKLLVFGAFALAVAAVVSPPPAAAQTTGATITVYNAQHASLAKACAAGFTRATGIKVIKRDGEDGEFANQIIQEGSRASRPTSS